MSLKLSSFILEKPRSTDKWAINSTIWTQCSPLRSNMHRKRIAWYWMPASVRESYGRFEVGTQGKGCKRSRLSGWEPGWLFTQRIYSNAKDRALRML